MELGWSFFTEHSALLTIDLLELNAEQGGWIYSDVLISLGSTLKWVGSNSTLALSENRDKNKIPLNYNVNI